MFDGVCAYCGALLHGHLNAHELGNKFNGVPVNIKGEVLERRDNATQADAQPPFLLRWAPFFFAEMMPEVFSWDEEKNCLSLTQAFQERPPWQTELHYPSKTQGNVGFIATAAIGVCFKLQTIRKATFLFAMHTVRKPCGHLTFLLESLYRRRHSLSIRGNCLRCIAIMHGAALADLSRTI